MAQPILDFKKELEQFRNREKNNSVEQNVVYISQLWSKCAHSKLVSDESRLEVLHAFMQIAIKNQMYARVTTHHKEYLELARNIGTVEIEMDALLASAVILGIQSDYKESMPLLLEALEKSKSQHTNEYTARILINIGNVYANLFNYAAALDRYNSVVRDYAITLDDLTLVVLHINIGNLNTATENFENALEHLLTAQRLAASANATEYLTLSNILLARTELQKKNTIDAQRFADDAAHSPLIQLPNTQGRSIHFLNIAELALLKNNITECILLSRQGVAIARRVSDDYSELRGFSILARAHSERKEFKQAFKAQTLYAERQERYLKKQREMHALDFEIRYALNDKQRKIEELTRENNYQSILLEKTSQITQQNEQLREVNAELQQFAYITAHDLKEPLRMIGSFTQILFKEQSKIFSSEAFTHFKFINEGVTRMSALLDALLQYAIIGRTNIETESVSVESIVNMAISNLRIAIDESHAEITLSDLPTVRVSASLYVQLFQNLLSNAIKFKSAQEIPKIHITSETFENGFLFKIKDNGVGINVEHRERIFVIFQRLHSRDKYAGTGIGLSISQKIVRQFGGKIWVESEEDKGATFCFTLPQ